MLGGQIVVSFGAGRVAAADDLRPGCPVILVQALVQPAENVILGGWMAEIAGPGLGRGRGDPKRAAAPGTPGSVTDAGGGHAVPRAAGGASGLDLALMACHGRSSESLLPGGLTYPAAPRRPPGFDPPGIECGTCAMATLGGICLAPPPSHSGGSSRCLHSILCPRRRGFPRDFGRIRPRMCDIVPTKTARAAAPRSKRLPDHSARNGFDFRSIPMVVGGPWPAYTVVSSGRVRR